jgi:Arc/MetJ family transcription regulator
MPRPTTRRKAKARPPARERKNMRLDQALLDSAKRALGTASETEAVTLALRRVVDNARVAAGLRALGGSRILDAARVDDPAGSR